MEVVSIVKMILFTVAFWLFLIVIGFHTPAKRTKKITELLMGGMILFFFLFEILALCAVFFRWKFHTLYWLVMGISVVLFVSSIVQNWDFIMRLIRFKKQETKKQKGSRLWYLPAVVLIVVQMYAGIFYTHIDDDDAFYVATASTTLETDTVFQYNAYTGDEYESLPSRYVLSPFPIFEAGLSRLYGVPSTVLGHTGMFLIFLPVAYFVYDLLGSFFWKNKRKERGLFLLFLAWMNIFGYYSVYTMSTFLLIRIWQGKAVLAAVILPLLFYYLLCAYKNEYQIQDIIQIFLTTGAAALTSSMGIFLAPIMVALGAFAGIIQTRKIGIAWKLLAGCIPCIILTGIYLLLRVEGMG